MSDKKLHAGKEEILTGGIVFYEVVEGGTSKFVAESTTGDLRRLCARVAAKHGRMLATVTNADLHNERGQASDLWHIDHSLSHQHHTVRDELYLLIFMAGRESAKKQM